LSNAGEKSKSAMNQKCEVCQLLGSTGMKIIVGLPRKVESIKSNNKALPKSNYRKEHKSRRYLACLSQKKNALKTDPEWLQTYEKYARGSYHYATKLLSALTRQKRFREGITGRG